MTSFMTNELEGRRVAFMVANGGMEETEFTEPGKPSRMPEGCRNSSPEAGTAQAFNHLDKADTFPVDRAIGDADPGDYDALVRGRTLTSWPSLQTDIRNAGGT
jgi:protease I